MAEKKLSFDQLSTADVKKLYEETRRAAQKERGQQAAEAQSSSDLGFDEEYHLDGFGNVIPGKKPPAKQSRTYVDADGYVRELNDGEVAPGPQGSSVLEKITKFANEYSTDPEVAKFLPVDETFFEITLTESGWLLRGEMKTSGTWIVVATHATRDNLKFPLSGNLTREEAIQSASHHVRAVTDPEPRTLTPAELRRVAILASNATAVSGVSDAAVLYIRLATGDESISVGYLERPDRKDLLTEAIYYAWRHSYFAKGYVETEEILEHVNAYIAGRDFVTIQTFNDAWSSFKEHQSRGLGGWRLERPEPQPLTPKQIEEMSDSEIEANLAEARRLHREGKLQD